KRGDAAGLEELERECLRSNARHHDWECTERLMALTRQERDWRADSAAADHRAAADRRAAADDRAAGALYMHCLPADITGVSCPAGEVAADVFERYRLLTYAQAGHKPFVIAAMMLLTRCADA